MKDFSLNAKIYILLTITIGTGLGLYQLIHINGSGIALLALAGLASVAQILKVEGSTQKSSYNIGWLIYGFSFTLMGAPAAMFVILVAHLVEWAWHKYPWYIQMFNIANYAVAVSMAGLVYNLTSPALTSPSLLSALSALAALGIFTLINHTLIGLVIWFARGQTFRESGVFGMLTLMIDFSLLGLGTATALIWEINPFATVFSLVPIYLIYSTLQVPALQRQTEIDPKTKLYNARYFAEALKKELDRAERFDRPLTVVIGDLDLLRNINNTYGHLAGDVVLIGVAEILQNHFRGYDLVARFGGEEFAILLPEITPQRALPRVESVRQAIEMADFNVSTSVTPIKATISFGIAERDAIQKSADQIIHDADVALYQAKLKGRNATCVYSTDGIEEVFGKDGRDRIVQEDLALGSRLEASEIPTQVNPLRQQATEKTVQPQKKAVKKRRSNQLWWVNAYIGALALVALGLITFTFKIDPVTDWFGLAIFALLILLTEGLSIDLYVNDTSISTATAPLIAGSLLYGPEGALILSLTLAATAMIKHRSQIIRFIFNASNHFISSSLCAFLIIISGISFTAQSAYVRLAFAVLAGILIYFVSTLLLSGVLSLSMEQPFWRVWRERFRWLLPYYIAFGVAGYVLILGYSAEGILGLGAVLVPLLMLRFSQTQYVENTKSMVSQLRTQNFELENQSNEISNLNEDLLISLANVIDLRDTATRGHSEGVAHFAVLIGEELGLSAEHIERIRKSGLLHDIGKIGIPDAILFKPNALTVDEYEIVKQHPVRGAEILITNKSLRNLSPIIRHHHERYDGGGYPDGLAGHDIPLEARILNLADSLQAMCSNRPYRRALRLPEIISEITENAGTQFDPRVVKAFLDGLPRVEAKLSATIARSQFMDEPETVEVAPADQGTVRLGRLRTSY